MKIWEANHFEFNGFRSLTVSQPDIFWIFPMNREYMEFFVNMDDDQIMVTSTIPRAVRIEEKSILYKQ